MSDVLTHRLAGAVSGQHSTKPGFKAWGVSLIALGLVAGGAIVGPQLFVVTGLVGDSAAMAGVGACGCRLEMLIWPLGEPDSI